MHLTAKRANAYSFEKETTSCSEKETTSCSDAEGYDTHS